ncbi:hypothetical protein GQ53DRAFT_538393 [Thozetella sp. PMI_491]|nr:hypothetical protein GQ53DRAFT_538393 [Thozetella sp. PMI_491]
MGEKARTDAKGEPASGARESSSRGHAKLPLAEHMEMGCREMGCRGSGVIRRAEGWRKPRGPPIAADGVGCMPDSLPPQYSNFASCGRPEGALALLR